MGLFINTLPVRMRVGAEGAEASVRAHARGSWRSCCGTSTPRWRWRSGAAAWRPPRRSSAALLNYRHNAGACARVGRRRARRWEGSGRSRGEERTNYPLALSVDDLGEGFGLTAQAPASVDAARVCALMHARAGGAGGGAGDGAGPRRRDSSTCCPRRSGGSVLEEWNATGGRRIRADACVHELFEAQVERTPDAVAVVFGDDELTLRRAERAGEPAGAPPARSGVSGPTRGWRSAWSARWRWWSALLAMLKAGGAYVPLDPDVSGGAAALHARGRARPPVRADAGGAAGALRAGAGVPRGGAGRATRAWSRSRRRTNPERGGLTPEHLAYVIYTSGSTGQPKGVDDRAPRRRATGSPGCSATTGSSSPMARCCRRRRSASTCRCGSSSGR